LDVLDVVCFISFYYLDARELTHCHNHHYGHTPYLSPTELTENDEFVYQEMISHLPLMAHKNPKNVLIVGGGDGAVLREVCRHKTVQSITLVEIDQKVIEVAKKFFTTTTATTFDDPRVTIVHQDAAEFLEKQNASDRKGYDVIIADSSDPVGPAESLFDPAFYEQMYEALDDGGIICTQGDCFWTHPELIENVVACCADIFDAVEYATTYVPTYPCGQIGFIVAGKGEGMNLTKPARKMDAKLAEEMEWYTEEIHSASFVLPKFLEEKIAELRPQYKDEEDEDEEDEDGMKGDCFLQRCVIS
jgi:spermidine synthase